MFGDNTEILRKVPAALALALGTLLTAAPACGEHIHLTPADSIQNAIQAAPTGAHIVLAGGAYQESIKIIETGKELTICAAEGAEVTITAPPLSRIFLVHDNGAPVVFRGIEFLGGAPAQLAGVAMQGGAGVITESTVDLIDCVFRGNVCMITDIDASSGATGGGALRIVNSDVLMEHCAFIENQAVVVGVPTFFNDLLVRGGAVDAADSSLEIIDCDFVANTVVADIGMHLINLHVRTTGGAIQAYRSDVALERCRFIGNTVAITGDMNPGQFEDQHGGAIQADSPSQSPRTFIVNSSLFAENSVDGTGAAMNFGVASDGSSSMTVDILNCTIAANLSASSSGAIVVWNDEIECRIGNSIIAFNNASHFAGDRINGPATSLGHNMFHNVDASFESFATNGDMLHVDPIFVDPGAGDYRLAPNSPALDAGDTTLAIEAGLLLDLAGAARAIALSDAPVAGVPAMTIGGLVAIDIGAFERRPDMKPSFDCPGDFNGDGRVNAQDLAELLSKWGFCPE